jgi:hypothetical protein
MLKAAVNEKMDVPVTIKASGGLVNGQPPMPRKSMSKAEKK